MDPTPREQRSTRPPNQQNHPRDTKGPTAADNKLFSRNLSGDEGRLRPDSEAQPDSRKTLPDLEARAFQPLEFHSILFVHPQAGPRGAPPEPPAFLVDLNLDQIIDAIAAGREEYDLKPFFYQPLNSVEAIEYRHEIMQDLESAELLRSIKSFAKRMRTMREHLDRSGKLHYRHQRNRWFLDAVAIYCDAVKLLHHDLSRTDPESRGFRAFREYLGNHVNSAEFEFLAVETAQLAAALSSIHYCLQIKGTRVTVRKYEGETDYSADVEATFEKFKQGAAHDYRAEFLNPPEMNPVEAKILELVAQLYPDIFSDLDDYCVRNRDFADGTTTRFDREIQFYIGYLEYIAKIRQAGLQFCYPLISKERNEIFDRDGFDLALAAKLIQQREQIVCNDFYLRGQERIFIVSGPNQGGKTTFARTFGQLHYLAGLGCPVPGRKAQLYLFDRLFTHFEKEENIKNLRGKLQDDLVRIHDILTRATPRSIIIINEIFTSTTLEDALFLSKAVMEKIGRLDLLSVCVTFLDELASLNEKTVSMVSTIVPEDPASRTYKIVRRAADGYAYALSIAEKYEVTYDSLKERIRS